MSPNSSMFSLQSLQTIQFHFMGVIRLKSEHECKQLLLSTIPVLSAHFCPTSEVGCELVSPTNLGLLVSPNDKCSTKLSHLYCHIYMDIFCFFHLILSIFLDKQYPNFPHFNFCRNDSQAVEREILPGGLHVRH